MEHTAHHTSPTARTTPSPWALRAWPPVLWQAGQASGLHLRHLNTSVTVLGSGHQPTLGQTLWAAHSNGHEAGLAWDWVQLARGVVTLADPLSVVSNLRLLGGEGQVLTAIEATRVLNEIVHRLPWQPEVTRTLRGPVQ